ncbi:MAG: cytochrome c oxidase subunit II [Mariprofundaceae bacterium]|nr:cytochrome c oxidase subunit II [Mariprofundaceae bacterium]
MKLKSWTNRIVGSLLALPLVPALGHAFTIERGDKDYGMTPHEHYDHVWDVVMEDILVIGVLFSLVCLYIIFTSFRKSKDEVGTQRPLSKQWAMGWLIIPIAVFLADDLYLFAKGMELHNHYRNNIPTEAQEIKVTASLWNWNYNYGSDVETDGELIVPVGKPVLLRMSSDDVLHSHYMRDYRVTEDVMPGRVTYQWFMPDTLSPLVKVTDEDGEVTEQRVGSRVTCREYCGEGHSNMYGVVRVLSQADYDAWWAGEAGLEAPVVEEAAPVVEEAVAAVEEAVAPAAKAAVKTVTGADATAPASE